MKIYEFIYTSLFDFRVSYPGKFGSEFKSVETTTMESNSCCERVSCDRSLTKTDVGGVYLDISYTVNCLNNKIFQKKSQY